MSGANNALRSLMVEAEFTGARLAKAVNMAGAESGLDLRYDRSAVAHWLAGTRPRPPAAALVAEVFSRHLGRRVTQVETGLGDPDDPRSADRLASWWGADVRNWLESGAGERSDGSGGVYSLAAFSVPSWSEIAHAHPVLAPGPGDGGGKRLGRTELRAAQALVQVFADGDMAHGGGYARSALTGYLAAPVSSWLSAPASAAVHRDLLSVAAKLSYLAAFMCFDEQRHPDAQRYYLTGLRLASEAGDRISYAVCLRALSVQAQTLGHGPHALRHAEAAVETAWTGAPHQTRAFLAGQLAVAHATTGSRRAALAQLSIAERCLERDGGEAAPVGGYHQAALLHQHAMMATALGDRRGAIAALQVSLRRRPPAERRSRAVTTAHLADLLLAAGRLEEACHTWQRFCDDVTQLRSARADKALATIAACTRPYQRNASARSLRDRVLELRNLRRGR